MSDWSIKGILTLDSNQLKRELGNSKGEINKFANEVKTISGRQGLLGAMMGGSQGGGLGGGLAGSCAVIKI